MNESNRSEGYAVAPATIRLGDLEVQRLGYGAMRLPGKEVWGEARGGSARALDVFVCKLRDKIEDDPSAPRYIKTVRGAGYSCG